MRKDLMRRIEKLEQGGSQTSQFQAKLRYWARVWGVHEEAFLRAAEGYEQELRRGLGDDGMVTWEIYQLLRDLAGQLGTGARPEAAKEESK
jgi:hypothetical protein